MKNKSNLQPSVNPKPLTVQRGYADGEAIFGEVFIRNVSVDPRELIRSPHYVSQKRLDSNTTLAVLLHLMRD